jgi:hypothetical protein
MVSTRPEILKYIELTGVKLLTSEFNELNKPEPNSNGHTTFTFKINPQFKKKAAAEFPSRMIQNVEITVRAFLGDDAPEVGSNKDLATCKVTFALNYNIKKPSYSEQSIFEHQWFFQAQAVLIGRDLIRTILQRTDYSGMPLPYEIHDDISISEKASD